MKMIIPLEVSLWKRDNEVDDTWRGVDPWGGGGEVTKKKRKDQKLLGVPIDGTYPYLQTPWRVRPAGPGEKLLIS